MDLGALSQEKIYGALRSAYRYREMTEGDAPEILIEAEARLLKERFALLNAREIFEIIQVWPRYLAQQSAIEVIDDQRFEQYLGTIN